MKVLVIGSGGREHALCWKLSQSPRIDKIYCAPGNGGTGQIGENLDLASNDIEGILKFAQNNQIDLTLVGPEEALVLGIVDRFQEAGLKIFGPNKKSAQLEASKDFSKRFMERHGINTARYRSFSDFQQAVEALEDYSYPLVIKADGLCLGKGVIICNSKKEAIECLEDILLNKAFGDEGSTVVIEEFLDGVEASLLCLVSKGKIIPMESVRDYKKIFDNDLGPNTGGVGAYSPSGFFNDKMKEDISNSVLEKIRLGLEKDGLEYSGILFIGFMFVGKKPYVLEFNVRFGDPETEVLMPRLESDLVEILEKTIDDTIEKNDLIWDERPCLTVILTSEGYPEIYKKGYKITGTEDLNDSIILYHNGTKYKQGSLLTNGGRVLSVTSLGDTMKDARENIYRKIEKINFHGMKYRKDIGKY